MEIQGPQSRQLFLLARRIAIGSHTDADFVDRAQPTNQHQLRQRQQQIIGGCALGPCEGVRERVWRSAPCLHVCARAT
jgi:hypothetical protein